MRSRSPVLAEATPVLTIDTCRGPVCQESCNPGNTRRTAHDGHHALVAPLPFP